MCITALFIVLILLYVPRWSSIFICVFYFAFAEAAESFDKHEWMQVQIIIEEKIMGERGLNHWVLNCNKNSGGGGAEWQNTRGMHFSTAVLRAKSALLRAKGLHMSTCHLLEIVPLTIPFTWKILKSLAVYCQHSF